VANQAMNNATCNDFNPSKGNANAADILPVDPFSSLYVHFGMLLGVEDFRTLNAYHRGKTWFHNSWLHGAGVIWGLKVSLSTENNEILVAPGMALDGMGRELYLARAACLDLNAWYEKYKDEQALKDAVTVDEESGAISLDAHVVIRSKACLDRQVPALNEPCDSSQVATAYSRTRETVELLLLPGKSDAWRDQPGDLPFHLVRLLFGLEQAKTDEEGVTLDNDQAVLNARNAVLALPADQQPAAYLKWLRHFAPIDEMAMAPPDLPDSDSRSLFADIEPAQVLLADVLELTLNTTENGWRASSGAIDNGVRPVHIPTSTIQELMCGPRLASADSGSGTGSVIPDADGPRVDPESVVSDNEFIHFNITNGPLMRASVEARGISVTAFDSRDGWITNEIKKVSYDKDNEQVTVELRDAPGATLLRLIVRGTGPFPILGRNRVPLAGSSTQAQRAGGASEGIDFVTMFRIRS